MVFVGQLQCAQLGRMTLYTRSFDVEAFVPDQQTLGILRLNRLESAVKKRQAEFIAGRYVAKDALSDLGFSNDTAIPIGRNRAPLWPAGVVGSISHNHNTAVCVVGKSDSYGSLGIDVETILEPSVTAEVLPLIATQSETAIFCPSQWNEQSMATLLFSAKESLFKALYPLVQHYLEFKDAILTEIDDVQGTAQFTFSRHVTALCGLTECQTFFRFTTNQVVTLTRL
ncbi:4'-phosphopantetheinyl transferase superfamily protein [Vibrio sp.]|nr:4'-phosphopantetheinyl transferase superfamily protein [Vibrio sp.]